ncbi:MAG: FHA domain-containing protein [Gemmatales bacterium]|nr:FHA domain-containing protein [Gemmatales bacterium]MCS7160888.1 FHA domain-containing protein [Gemmatales bacterium]MDW8176090.1 FHA domain-containing protein [Gemmatales bacterium]MDW8223975.1 FHA domain-containing protein [Gemmatales bacterium]
MKIYLVPEDGSRPYELVKDITLVGRSRVCDIQVRDKAVSKLHCVLVKTDSLVLVRDLGSTNGTLVKDIPVKRGMLLPNDELTIGRVRYRLHFLPDDAPPPRPKEDWVRTEQMRVEGPWNKDVPYQDDLALQAGPLSSPPMPQIPEVEPPIELDDQPPFPPHANQGVPRADQ